jgi:hypothetical protein
LYWARFGFLGLLIGAVALLGWMTFRRDRR